MLSNAECKKSKNDKSEKNKQMDKVQMGGLGGNLYQVKLLMLFLYNGLKLDHKYKLGTEIGEAGKFDDIVFEYESKSNKNERNFILVQAKHDTSGTGKINISNLLEEHFKNFGVYKYFQSYIDAKNNKFFDGFIKRMVICSNKTFDNDKFPEKWVGLKNMANIIEKIDPIDNDLNLCRVDNKGEFYRFKSEIMFPVLKNIFTECILKMIAKCLVDSLSGRKSMQKEDTIEMYHKILFKEVIDIETNKFQKSFVKGKSFGSSGLIQFRDILITALNEKKLSLEEVNEKLKFNFKQNVDYTMETNREDDVDEITFDNIVRNIDIKEFLEKFVMAVEQPDESSIGNHLQKKLEQDFSSDQIYSNFFIEVTNWTVNGNGFSNSVKSEDKRFISSEEAQKFFTHENRKIYNCIINTPFFEYEKKINELQCRFQEDGTKRALCGFLESSNVMLFLTTSFVDLSLIKIHQFLAAINYEFISTEFNSLSKSSIVLKIFDSKLMNHSLLIISCYDGTTNLSVENKIVDILNRNRDKKIIAIAKNDDRNYAELRKEFSKSNSLVIVNDEKLGICDMDSISKQSILEKTLVLFQDQKVYLKDLMNERCDSLIDEEQLSKILTNRDLKFGKITSNLNYTNQNYISRKFFIQFDFDDNSIMLISGINEDDFCNKHENIKFDNYLHSRTINESERIFFNQHRERNSSKKVYLLRKDEENINLIAKTENFLFKPNDLIEKIKSVFKKTIILLTSSPGMGKTYVFSHLRDIFKMKDPTLWVYRIDLNGLVTSLKDIQRKGDFNKIALLEFLYKAVNAEEEIEMKLFKNLLEEGKTVLFLDGLDEVSPQYSKEMVKIIKTIHQVSKTNRIFINTRPYDKVVSGLSTKFDFLYCRLQQFTDEDQIEFFRKSWDIGFNDKNFQLFVKKLLHVFNGTIRDDGLRFMGTALHTMMIATTFKKTYEKYIRSKHREIDEEGQQTIKESLNLFTLYKNFVKIKSHDVYYQEKNNVDPFNACLEQFIQKEYDYYVEKCQILSLMNIFEREKIDMFFDENIARAIENYKIDINSNGDRVGLITSYRDEKPNFVHKSYAEYFVTDFIIKIISQRNSIQDTVIRFFLFTILQGENEMICRFANDAIHEDIDETAIIWSQKNIEYMHGRVLHFTIQCNCRNIAKILICNGIDVTHINTNRETVFHLIYEMSSDQNIQCDLVSLILAKNDSKSETFKDLLLKKSIDRKKTPILLAAKNQNLHQVRELILILRRYEILEDAIDTEDCSNENVLHLALFNKNLDVFKFFIYELKEHEYYLRKLLSANNNQGFNPLMLATMEGSAKNIKCIIDVLNELRIINQVIASRNYLNNNIFNLAAVNENPNVLKTLLDDSKLSNELLTILLRNKGYEERSPLLSAAFEGNIYNMQNIIRSLDRLKILEDEMNSRDTGGNNILHFAIANKNDDVFDLIIQCLKERPVLFKSINQSIGKYGRSPLFYAAVEGNVKCFKTIINILEELQLVDKLLHIPGNQLHYNILHQVISDRNVDLFKFILGVLENRSKLFKIMLKHRSDENFNILMIAAFRGNMEIFELTYSIHENFSIFQSEVEHKDNKMNNILQLAIKNKNNDMLEFVMTKIKNYPELFQNMLRNRNNKNITILMKSIIQGNSDHFKLILNALKEFEMLDEVISLDNYNNNVLQMLFSNKNNDIHESVMNELKSHPELLKILMKNKGFKNYTPLLTAIVYGTIEHFKCIIKTMTSLNILHEEDNFYDANNNSILHLAIMNSDCFMLENVMTELGVHKQLFKSMLNHKGAENLTVLLFAARQPNTVHIKSICNFLKDLDIFEDQINVSDAYGNNMIHLAISNNHSDVLEFVLELLKDREDLLKKMLRQMNVKCHTPLLTAANFGNSSHFIKIFNTLFELKILNDELYTLDVRGKNFLQLMIFNQNYELVKRIINELKAYPEVLKMLLRHKDVEDNTVLMTAANSGDSSLFKYIFQVLIQLGALYDELFTQDANGRISLQLMILKNNNEQLKQIIEELKLYPEVLKRLLQYKDVEDNTPMMMAANISNFFAFKYIFQTLIELRILYNEILTVDRNGKNFLQQIIFKNNNELFKQIITELKLYPEELKTLLQHKDIEDNTMLMTAAKINNMCIFKYIFSTIIELDILDDEIYALDINGRNFLHLMISKNNNETLKQIINELKSYPIILINLLQHKDIENNTVLMTSANFNNLNIFAHIFRTLIELGALEEEIFTLDVNGRIFPQLLIIENKKDYLEMIINELKVYPEVLKRLLLHKDAEDNTVFMTAASFGNSSIFNCIFNTFNELDILIDEIYSLDTNGKNLLQLMIIHNKNEVFVQMIERFKSYSEVLKGLLQHKDNINNTVLITAINFGDLSIFKCIFRTLQTLGILNSEIFALDVNSKNFLQLMILKNNNDFFQQIINELTSYPEVLKILLQHRDNENNTILMTATNLGNFSVFKYIFQTLFVLDILDDEIFTPDANGRTFLQVMIMKNKNEFIQEIVNELVSYPEVLKILLQHRDNENNTILMTAANLGNFSIFKYIFQTLFVLDILDDEIFTPDANGRIFLQVMILKNNNEFLQQIINDLKLYPEVLKKLLQHKDFEDNTVLMTAVNSDNLYFFQHIFHTLNELGILEDEICVLDVYGKNFLQRVIIKNNHRLLECIIEELKSYPGVLKILLEHKDFEENSVLMTAANFGILSVFQTIFFTLISLGILDDELFSFDTNGKNFLQQVILKNNNQLWERIINELKWYSEALRTLLQYRDIENNSVLMTAANFGNLVHFKNIFLTLIELDISNVEIYALNANGNNFLQLAIFNNNKELLVQIVNELNMYPEVLKNLLQHKDAEDKNAVMIAASNGDISQFICIFDRMIDFNILNMNSQNGDIASILNIAVANQNAGVVEYLRNYVFED